MKNIHVLKTDKPTRLFTSDSVLILAGYPATTFKTGKNIYITSDEEIKEGDWCFDSDGKQILKFNNRVGVLLANQQKEKYGTKSFFKIILTTDQDLIKDGVQSIDDKFLEWFVKNPNCDEIEIEKRKLLQGTTFYKIIIPKEESKQDYNKVHLKHCYQGEYEDGCKYGEDDCPAKPLEEPKQETLEEAAENYVGYTGGFYKTEELQGINDFIEGTKWQQEQDKNKYSEEEVLMLLRKRDKHTMNHGLIGKWLNPKDWFEQFKKK